MYNIQKVWTRGNLRIFFNTHQLVSQPYIARQANLKGWRVLKIENSTDHLKWECEQINKVWSLTKEYEMEIDFDREKIFGTRFYETY